MKKTYIPTPPEGQPEPDLPTTPEAAPAPEPEPEPPAYHVWEKPEGKASYTVRTLPGSDLIHLEMNNPPLRADLKLTVKGAFQLARILFEAGEVINERIDRETGET